MRFWDTSGLIPLLVEQEASREVRPLFEEDPDVVAWWGTAVECASAAARLRREDVFSLEDEEGCLSLLNSIREGWLEIMPSNEVRNEAMRLLRVHSLRAGDALQIAAALLWRGSSPGGELVTFDDRMRLAARLEGMRVLPL